MANGQLQHYVLSIAVPNDKVDELVLLKKEADSAFKEKFESSTVLILTGGNSIKKQGF